MTFEFCTATRVVFGPGRLREVGPAAARLGQRALLVTGRSRRRAKALGDSLRTSGIATEIFPVGGEPTTTIVQSGAEQARAAACEFVIGFGGGSVLDAAKAVAALCTNPGNLVDYLEVIGRGQSIAVAPLPWIAIPTTAGTGAEVTRNAVLASTAHQVKVSLRSPLLLPRLAVVDPELTYSLPPRLTATTGLDALTQLIEPFVSSRANPLTDALCREGMSRAARSLRPAHEHARRLHAREPADDNAYRQAREDLALASLFSGMALANAGLGAVHGFAAPIGGRFPAPHGAVCAALLPHVMATNIAALHQREPNSEALRRYAEVARILTARSVATPEAGVEWVLELCADLEIPPLKQYGLAPEDVPDLVAQAAQASSMKGNPLPLTAEEMAHALRCAL